MGRKKIEPAESALTGSSVRDEEAASTMKAMQWLQNMADTESAPIGKAWNLPAEYEHWHIVDLDFSVERHKMTYFQLKQMGYKDCPPAMRRYGCTHTPTKKYLMCPPAVKEMQKQIRRDKLRKVAHSLKNELDSQNKSLNMILGSSSSAEILHQSGGEDTLDNIQDQVRKTRA
tara:strand:+ start:269 stop:787 length:519 start_codon:yes stop_codon:yes gene_type:complete